jgi:hypothetical protein
MVPPSAHLATRNVAAKPSGFLKAYPGGIKFRRAGPGPEKKQEEEKALERYMRLAREAVKMGIDPAVVTEAFRLAKQKKLDPDRRGYVGLIFDCAKRGMTAIGIVDVIKLADKKRKEEALTAGSAERDGKRGTISGLSMASRRRFVEKLMRIFWNRSASFFVTLTWHLSASDSFDVWKSQLDAFHKRMVRKYPQLLGIVWRLELKPRKRGPQVGAWKPHFHLVLFFDMAQGPRLAGLREFVSSSWNSIVEPDDPQHKRVGTSVLRVKNTYGEAASRLMGYLCKYLAKSERLEVTDHASGEVTTIRTGRVWGFLNEKRIPGLGDDDQALGLYVLDKDQWYSFVARINLEGDRIGSRMMSRISDAWQGFRLLGDGQDLLARLCSGFDLLLASEIPNYAR